MTLVHTDEIAMAIRRQLAYLEAYAEDYAAEYGEGLITYGEGLITAQAQINEVRNMARAIAKNIKLHHPRFDHEKFLEDAGDVKDPGPKTA